MSPETTVPAGPMPDWASPQPLSDEEAGFARTPDSEMMLQSAQNVGEAAGQGLVYGAVESVTGLADLPNLMAVGGEIGQPESWGEPSAAAQRWGAYRDEQRAEHGGPEPLYPSAQKAATEALPFSPKTTPRTLRPMFEMTRAVGGQGPFVAAGAGLAKKAGESVAKRVGTEAPLVGASAAGRAMGLNFSDDEMTLALWEGGGGLFASYGVVGIASRVLPGVVRKMGHAITSRSKRGRTTAAAREFQRIFAADEVDIPALQKLLREIDPVPGVELSAAQKTLNETLIGIEHQLLSKAPGKRSKMETVLRDNIEKIKLATEFAMKSGDPTLIKAAFEARKAALMGRAHGRVRAAEQAVQNLSTRFNMATTVGRRRANTGGRSIIRRMRDLTRREERGHWNRIPELPVEGEGLADTTGAWNRVMDRVLPDEKVTQYRQTFRELAPDEPEDVERLTQGLFDEFLPDEAIGAPVTTQRLIRLRSRILREIRQAKGVPSPDLQRISALQELQGGILSDLNKIDEIRDHLDIARGYSRERAVAFNQGYVGRVLALDPRGGPRIRPENTIEDAFSPGEFSQFETTENLRDLRKASGFDDNALRLQQMHGVEQEVIWDVAKKVLDENNHVDLRKLREFRRTYGDTLDDFPDLRSALDDMGTAQRYFERVGGIVSRGTKTANNLKHLGKLTKTDKPAEAFRVAIQGQDWDGLDSFFRTAAKTPQGKAGARAALFDAFLELSVDTTGRGPMISGQRLKALLGDNEITAMARRRGILDESHLRAYDIYAETAEKVEGYLKLGYARTSEVVEQEDMLFDVFARLIGAQLTSASPIAHSTGSSLVWAHVGSKSARRILENIPSQKIKDVMIEALNNPRMLADMLDMPTDARKVKMWSKRMNAYLYHAGITDKEN